MIKGPKWEVACDVDGCRSGRREEEFSQVVAAPSLDEAVNTVLAMGWKRDVGFTCPFCQEATRGVEP